MLFPLTLWGFARQVSIARNKCYREDCLTITGTRYGHHYTCSRHALELAVLERNAPQEKGA